MMQIHLQFDSLAELDEFVTRFRGNGFPFNETPAPVPVPVKAEAPKPAAPKKPAPTKAAAPAPEPKPAEPASEARSVTVEEVRKQLIAVREKCGDAPMKEILAAFKANTVKQIEESDYLAVYDRCMSVIEAEPAAA